MEVISINAGQGNLESAICIIIAITGNCSKQEKNQDFMSAFKSNIFPCFTNLVVFAVD